jgi:predicted amidohydrolase YtcJ
MRETTKRDPRFDVSIGEIAAGKRADLALLDRDALTISPEEMRDAKVLWTMVAGKTVYRSK